MSKADTVYVGDGRSLKETLKTFSEIYTNPIGYYINHKREFELEQENEEQKKEDSGVTAGSTVTD